MSDVDDRIAAALRAAAGRVSAESLRPAAAPTAATARSRRTARWIAPLLAAAVVAGIGITVAEVSSGHRSAAPTIRPGQSSSGSSSSSSTGTPSSPARSTSPAPFATGKPGPAGGSYCFFGDVGCKGFHSYYVPMWPFANVAEATRTAGLLNLCKTAVCKASPNRDYAIPAATSLDFVEKFLGFTDITRVTSTVISNDQAHIGVGYLNPNGKPATAAVIHLVKYERRIGDQYAPWEVVGTDDTTFSLETPGYGAAVPTTFVVGGHITGVDESIRVALLHRADAIVVLATKLAQYCCLPAGGQNSPWSVPIHYPSNAGLQSGDALTIVASTGGHVQQHERFAVQGVYVPY
jgi:hypothetical protein